MNGEKGRISIHFLWILLTLTLSCSLFGQVKPILQDRAVENGEVVTFKLSSKLMAREIPYRVVFPPRYKFDTVERYPVIYLLHGLTGHFDNWIDKSNLKVHTASHKFIIVTPEGDNGWYTDNATIPNHRYESYIIQELIPEIDRKFRTKANRSGRAIAGLSMGGYGALKFGIKHPETFLLAGSFSGALGVVSFTETARDVAFMKSINAILRSGGQRNAESKRSFQIGT